MVPVVVLQLAPILHIAEASVAVVAAQVLAQTIQIASARRLSLATGHGNPQKEPTRESYWTLVKEWIKMDKELLIAFPSFFFGLLCKRGEVQRWTTRQHLFATVSFAHLWVQEAIIDFPYYIASVRTYPSPHLDSILCFNSLQPLDKQQHFAEKSHIFIFCSLWLSR